MVLAPRPLTLIGFDPGLRRTGWGVITMSGNRLSRVAEGVVTTDEKLSLGERLATLYRGLVAILERYNPDEAAVEETYINRSGSASLKLGYARGVALLTPALAGIAAVPDYMHAETEGLVQVLEDLKAPKVDVYFVYPEELRNSKRVAVFRDFLLAQLAGR